MPSEPLSLHELQRRLFALITARRRVPDELHALGLPESFVSEHVRGDARHSAAARLDIYNGMYFFRMLEDVLLADYPTVAVVMGENFTPLVARYLEEHPPAHPSARYASARLPEFLRSSGGDHAAPAWLPSLAELEMARVDVFDEADDDLLTLPALRAMAPEALPALPLYAVKALRVVQGAADVASVWRAVAAGGAWHEPALMRCCFVVWRDDGHVYHRRADPDEAPLLELLQASATFAEVCERLGDQHADETVAAERAVALLARWAQDGLLARVPEQPLATENGPRPTPTRK